MKTAYLKIDTGRTVSHIHPEIYGHFSEHLGRCIYNGIWVGEDSPIPNINGFRRDIVEAFREIRMPVLRWPGGCFADEYHWRDGIGRERRKTVNSVWGQVTEDNSFGTHEFFGLCELLCSKPYLAANVGSGTVQELAEWMQYLTYPGDSALANERRANGHEKPFQVDYLGIGNENWGCGGNMRAEYYADQYRQYVSFARNYSGKTVNVACGPCGGDLEWMETMMKNRGNAPFDAISLHYYTVPTGVWEHKGDAVNFDEAEYYGTVANANEMEHIIIGNKNVMDKYDPEHKVGLVVDEWGCWYDAEPGTNGAFLYQQSTMRDAIIAAMHLNMFNRHSDRIVMANLAQAVNVLQAVLLTDGERLVKTPTWYVFKLFLPHHDADLLECAAALPKLHENGREMPQVSYSVSKKENCVFATLSNASLTEPVSLLMDAEGMNVAGAIGEIITAEVHAKNDFDGSEPVHIEEYSGFSVVDGKLQVTLPPCSVVSLTLR